MVSFFFFFFLRNGQSYPSQRYISALGWLTVRVFWKLCVSRSAFASTSSYAAMPIPFLTLSLSSITDRLSTLSFSDGRPSRTQYLRPPIEKVVPRDRKPQVRQEDCTDNIENIMSNSVLPKGKEVENEDLG